MTWVRFWARLVLEGWFMAESLHGGGPRQRWRRGVCGFVWGAWVRVWPGEHGIVGREK